MDALASGALTFPPRLYFLSLSLALILLLLCRSKCGLCLYFSGGPGPGWLAVVPYRDVPRRAVPLRAAPRHALPLDWLRARCAADPTPNRWCGRIPHPSRRAPSPAEYFTARSHHTTPPSPAQPALRRGPPANHGAGDGNTERWTETRNKTAPPLFAPRHGRLPNRA